MTRRRSVALLGAALAAIGVAIASLAADGEEPRGEAITVGILHSKTGALAISELPVIDATRMAIDEINERGGVLGRMIEVVELDGRSNQRVFAHEARRLIEEHGVSAIFGCWTSACRKTLKPIVEKHRNVLIYPVQYEGMEQSPNIVYLGAAPNQQIIPAVKWFFDNRGRRFFLVGSDYIFPRVANAVIRDYVAYLGGRIVGEQYVPIGDQNFDCVVEKIVRAKPAVILNTVNGNSNLGLFDALRRAGISPEKIPTVSFSVGEEEVRQIGPEKTAGDYAVWNYFQSIATKANGAFVTRFKKRYGESRVTGDAIAAGYFGVYLWAKAVEAAATDKPQAVLATIATQSFNAPEGTVYVDDENLHTWRKTRIGRVAANGQFEIMWESEAIIHPVPYPPYRTRAEWRDLLAALHKRWNGWERPAEAKGGAGGRERSNGARCRPGS